MNTSDARLVKLRCLRLPAGLNVDTKSLAVICTRLTRLESVGHLTSSTAAAVDFARLKQLRDFGPGMFERCATLTTISLSGLSQLTTVGKYFLCGCRSLRTVDLSGLSQLTTVGDQFLFGCTSLKVVDLSGLSQLSSIGKVFMFRCRAYCVKADGVSEALRGRLGQA